MTGALDLSRSTDLFRPEQQGSHLTIIGLGAVGNNLVQMLARMGVQRMTGFDDDVVEAKNCGPQGYPLRYVAKPNEPPIPKTMACAELVRDFTGVELNVRNERFVDQPLGGIVVTAVDDIDVRRAVWERVKYNPDVELFVDPRMGGLIGVIHTVRPCDPDDIEAYERTLFQKKDAHPEPCTARAIAYNAAGLAAILCGVLRGWWLTGLRKPVIRVDFGELTFLA